MDPVDANRLPTTGAVVDLVLAVTSFLAHYIMAAFRRMPNVSTNVPPRVRVLCPVAFVMLWAVLHVVATGRQPAFEACMVFVCIDVCGTMWSFHRYQLGTCAVQTGFVGTWSGVDGAPLFDRLLFFLVRLSSCPVQ